MSRVHEQLTQTDARVSARWRPVQLSGGERRAHAAQAVLLGCSLGILYGTLSLLRYNVGRAGNFDLGIFSQAAKSWQGGELPGSNIRGLNNLFADHFSPITALFGLAWSIWADPRSLLLAQAIAVGTAMGVIGYAFLQELPTRAALALVTLLGLSKGVIAAITFDVHEVGLGV